MKAVSIDWAKLDRDRKKEYFETTKRNRREYYAQIKAWEKEHGPKRSGDKQIKELEERRKKSIVSFLTHGMEFNSAAMFGQQGQSEEDGNDKGLSAENLDALTGKAANKENPEEEGEEGAEEGGAEEDEDEEEMDEDGAGLTEEKAREIQEFLEKKEYESAVPDNSGVPNEGQG